MSDSLADFTSEDYGLLLRAIRDVQDVSNKLEFLMNAINALGEDSSITLLVDKFHGKVPVISTTSEYLDEMSDKTADRLIGTVKQIAVAADQFILVKEEIENLWKSVGRYL